MLAETLDVLVMKRPIGKPKWATKKPGSGGCRGPPGKGARRSIITKAIQDELHAINKYQRYERRRGTHKGFCHLMNEKRARRRIYRRIIQATHEPLPEAINICRFRPGPFQPALISGMPQEARLASRRVLRHSSVRVVNNRDITGRYWLGLLIPRP